jgi:hypothetical protein
MVFIIIGSIDWFIDNEKKGASFKNLASFEFWHEI